MHGHNNRGLSMIDSIVNAWIHKELLKVEWYWVFVRLRSFDTTKESTFIQHLCFN